MPDVTNDRNSDAAERVSEGDQPVSVSDRIRPGQIILVSILTLYLAGCVYLHATRPGRGTEDWHTAIGIVVFAFYAVIGSLFLAPIIALLSIPLKITTRTASWIASIELLLILAFWLVFLVP